MKTDSKQSKHHKNNPFLLNSFTTKHVQVMYNLNPTLGTPKPAHAIRFRGGGATHTWSYGCLRRGEEF